MSGWEDDSELMRTMQEAQALIEEMDEVVALASQVSESVEELAGSFNELSTQILGGLNKVVRFSAKNSSWDTTLGIAATGAVAAGAARAIGMGIEKIGGAWARAKANRELKKQLVIKQELARAKLPTIEKTLPRLEGMLPRFERLLKMEAGKTFSTDETTRAIEHRQFTYQLFETVVRSEICLHFGAYLLEEFRAWEHGEHTSSAQPPVPDKIVFGNLSNMLEWGELQPYESMFDLPTALPQGLAIALVDPKLQDHTRYDFLVMDVAKKLGKARFWASVLPGKRARDFEASYEALGFGLSPAETYRAKYKSNIVMGGFLIPIPIAIASYIYWDHIVTFFM